MDQTNDYIVIDNKGNYITTLVQHTEEDAKGYLETFISIHVAEFLEEGVVPGTELSMYNVKGASGKVCKVEVAKGYN